MSKIELTHDAYGRAHCRGQDRTRQHAWGGRYGHCMGATLWCSSCTAQERLRAEEQADKERRAMEVANASLLRSKSPLVAQASQHEWSNPNEKVSNVPPDRMHTCTCTTI